MTTFTWQFDSLDVFQTYQGAEDVVESIHWRITASDGLGHEATAYGEVKAGPVDLGHFIPFNHLVSPVVQRWCEGQMGSALDDIKAQLIGQINAQANPVVVSMPVPW